MTSGYYDQISVNDRNKQTQLCDAINWCNSTPYHRIIYSHISLAEFFGKHTDRQLRISKEFRKTSKKSFRINSQAVIWFGDLKLNLFISLSVGTLNIKETNTTRDRSWSQHSAN